MKRPIAILPLVVAAALAGCQQPSAPSTPAAGESDTGAASPETTQRVISGEAMYRERIALPPGSRLRIQLVDGQLADTPKSVIAETEVAAGAPPIRFELSYDGALLRDNGMYGLHASLYGPDETLMFVTDTRQPVIPDSPAPVELMLTRVGQASEGAGAAFRARGNEPGWSVTVARGESPSMRIDLDYGERRLEVTAATPDGTGFKGVANDGTPVELQIERTACHDTMSDEAFGAVARLRAGDRSYEGCGDFIDP